LRGQKAEKFFENLKFELTSDKRGFTFCKMQKPFCPVVFGRANQGNEAGHMVIELSPETASGEKRLSAIVRAGLFDRYKRQGAVANIGCSGLLTLFVNMPGVEKVWRSGF